MAIKTISKLETFDNKSKSATAEVFNGALAAFLINNKDGDDTSTTCNDPNSPYSSTNAPALSIDNTHYTQTLFEVSKPFGPGTLPSEMYETKKITYDQVIANILTDVKSYLNTKNALRNIDVYGMSQTEYHFGGNKSFKNDVEIQGNLDVHGTTEISGVLTCKDDVKIEKKLEVTEKATFSDDIEVRDTADIKQKLQVTDTLTVDSRGLTVDINTSPKQFQVTNALTANASKVDINQNTTITENHTFTVKDGNTTLIGNKTDVVGVLNVYEGKSQYDTNLKPTGVINAGECDLTALHARWSDLAECYIADARYEPGTLVKFGGTEELTLADTEANAVVTSHPAVLMNSELSTEYSCAIALVGRVPVKIHGKIRKFDKLVLWKNGIAKRRSFMDMILRKPIIGIALVDSTSITVECAVKFRL